MAPMDGYTYVCSLQVIAFCSMWFSQPVDSDSFPSSSSSGPVQGVKCAPNTSPWAEECLRSWGQKRVLEEQPAF